MIESPGVAFMVVGDAEGSSSQAIFDSILDGWPILVLTVVMALLSGVIMWMLVSALMLYESISISRYILYFIHIYLV